jgi:hypothetical protein
MNTTDKVAESNRIEGINDAGASAEACGQASSNP